jgi:hypothetical protein
MICRRYSSGYGLVLDMVDILHPKLYTVHQTEATPLFDHSEGQFVEIVGAQ